MTTLVIVESPTKAKTIKKFLPDSFVIKASMGHIRDLPKTASEIPEELKKQEWAQIGVNYTDDFQPIYVIPDEKKKVVAELKKLVKEADEVILATDVDREGESISWHLLEVLKPKVPVRRMVFHEITRNAILKAMQEYREVDVNLVQAQEARRVLDRLVGYTLSPLLWKKIAVGLSAGRVQSVAVKQVVEREKQRMTFVKAQYCDLKAAFEKSKKDFTADLIKIGDKRVASGKDFDETTGKLKSVKDVIAPDSALCQSIIDRIRRQPFTVQSIDSKTAEKHPAPPFTTSTLQQEAGRKLGMSAKETMQTAQSLYENGLITYMRTDSVNLSNEALSEIKTIIKSRYGQDYLNAETRHFSNKVKNAQEAHEAIRPAGNFVPAEKSGLSGRERALYDMIWKRAVATQMKPAKLTYLSVFLAADEYIFRASGKKVDFAGYFRVYIEDYDDNSRDDEEMLLPEMKTGEAFIPKTLDIVRHETQPPARYTEAALISMLEKEGIGRPSTYASIISTVIDRGYIVRNKNMLIPTYNAFAVTHLLSDHFKDLVDTQFTAQMEEVLDDIAGGKYNYKKYLKQFYHGTKGLLFQSKDKTETISPIEYRNISLPSCPLPVLLGKYGPYLERTIDGNPAKVSVPEDIMPGDLNEDVVEGLFEMKSIGGNVIGTYNETGEKIYVLNGRFGPFIQLGEGAEGKQKPKRVPLLKTMKMQDVTIEIAYRLLSLPLKLGKHPQGGEISLGVGKFGPYVLHTLPNNAKEYRSVKEEDFMRIDLHSATEILNTPKKGRGSSAPLKIIGAEPQTGKNIDLYKGPYGHYLKFNGKNYALGKTVGIDTLTLEEAINIVSKTPDSKTKKTARRSAITADSVKASSRRANTAKTFGRASVAAKPAAKAPEPDKPASVKLRKKIL